MGLLRAAAGAVLIGAGTFRAEPRHLWTPEAVFPDLAEGFAELRRNLGLAPQPELFVVSRSGNLDPAAAAMRAGAVAVDARGGLAALLDDLRSRGHDRILTEGGPTLMGALLRERLVDDVFLSLAPVIAGRRAGERLGFAAGTALLPERRQAARLVSLRRAGDFVFARYNLKT